MKKERSAFQRKIDQICRVVFLTEEGKPKSTLLIYSFSLGLLFLALIMISYWVLVDPLEKAFASSPAWVRNIFEYIVPAIAGCIPCVALSFAFKQRMNMVPAAFAWVFFIAVIAMVTMIFMVDPSDWATEYKLFLAIAGIPMLVSSLVGIVASQIVYRRRMKAREAHIAKYSSRR